MVGILVLGRTPGKQVTGASIEASVLRAVLQQKQSMEMRTRASLEQWFSHTGITWRAFNLPIPIKSEFLGLGPRHSEFIKLPRGFQRADKFEDRTLLFKV